jgi:hypothetical protein
MLQTGFASSLSMHLPFHGRDFEAPAFVVEVLTDLGAGA